MDDASPPLRRGATGFKYGPDMVTLIEYPPSGNCYKVRLVCAHLGLSLKRVAVDLTKGEARTPEFRVRYPLGRVPVVELEDGRQLAESNAILWYFAEGTRLVPTDRLARAQTLQWMFFEQSSHEPYVAVARAWISFFGVPPGKAAELRERQEKAYQALGVMERHLEREPFFSGGQYGIADIALYAYTHVAHEGELELGRFPAIRDWCGRVASQPGYIPLSA